MKKIFPIFLAVIVTNSVFAQSTILTLSKTNPLPNTSYRWSIENSDSHFQLNSTSMKTSVLVTEDNYMMQGPDYLTPDVTTIICNDISYDLYPGNAIRCDLNPQSKLIIQDPHFKNGASGTFEIIE
jgi:hypothetical protein